MDSLKRFFRSCFARRSDHSARPASPPRSPVFAAATNWQEPTEPYPIPQYVYITTSTEANHHLQTIQAGAVISLDTEAVQRPRPKLSKAEKKAKLAAEIRDRASFVIDWSDVDTCLVQIATEEGHVFVINLHIMAELPQELVRICENRDILKVAAGIFSDGQRLWDSFRMDIFSAISLSLVARLAYPTTLMTNHPFAIEPALAAIVGHALGYTLSKEHQMSDWDAASLSGEQKNYAAIDAHASLRAFLTMRTLLDNCGYPVLPTWYTHDIFERGRVKCGTNEHWVAHCPWWSEDHTQGFQACR